MNTSRRIPKLRRYEQAIDAFIESPETDLDFIKSCFWELRNGYLAASRRLARWLVLAVVLACVFELINLRLIDKATISFIEITRFNLAMYVLPPVIAFTLIQTFAIAMEQYTYEKLIVKLAERRLPGLHKSNIDQLLLSQGGLLGADIPSNLRGRSENLLYAYNTLQMVLIVLVYMAFQAYAYSVLFSRPYSLHLTVLSLLATILLSIVLGVFFVTMLSDV